MKVYEVSIFYSKDNVCGYVRVTYGIFSTKQKAEEAKTKFESYGLKTSYVEIDEFELDKTIGVK